MKKLLIHMDDMGMNYAANKAGMDLFENGIATSASIMAPCPWAREFAEYSKKNPQFDVGAHMTFSCEWDKQRWRLFTSINEQPGFYDKEGFARRNMTDDDKCDVDCAAIEREMELQLAQLEAWGANISHIDSHMCVNTIPFDMFKATLRFANKHNKRMSVYKGLLWSDERTEFAMKELRHPICREVGLEKADNFEDKRAAFIKMLDNLEDGINVYTIHPVIETEEIKEIVPVWEERYLEYRLVRDKSLLKEIEDRGIQLVSWSDVLLDKE